jgi:hypothetical protein
LSGQDLILKINNIEVKYHEIILVLKGVSIEVPSWKEYHPQGDLRSVEA